LGVDAQRLVQAQSDFLTFERLESRQLERDRVQPRRQRRIPIRAVAAGDRGLRLNERRTGDRDADARKNSARVVGDDARDATAQLLRASRQAAGEEGGDEGKGNESSSHGCPSVCPCAAESKGNSRKRTARNKKTGGRVSQPPVRSNYPITRLLDYPISEVEPEPELEQ